ncbi:MAG TPA: sigma-70 family RNA polymerase sigma factor [Terriglobia bacterium]|nr:sigma-70 family RNA polymerase sigma factor [Terriglobia bacterium]
MQSPQPSAAQETAWIRRAQAGDREAFGQLVERYQKRVFALVFHLLYRRDEVEDIAQEIFFKVFRTIGSYNHRASFGTWLNRVAVNHCYDYLRRIRASRVSYFGELTDEQRHQLESGTESGGASGFNAERRIVLRDLVAKLLDRAPADDRVVLALKELQDLSVEEIADTLKLKPSTVKVRLHRARKRMLEDLKSLQRGR